MTDERMLTFIHSFDREKPDYLNELEQYSLETNVPIISLSRNGDSYFDAGEQHELSDVPVLVAAGCKTCRVRTRTVACGNQAD